MTSFFDFCKGANANNNQQVNYFKNIFDEEAKQVYLLSIQTKASSFSKACEMLHRENH